MTSANLLWASIAREEERRDCLSSFSAFVHRGWGEIDSTPLVWNWHLDILCEELEALSRGETRNLLINIPPGHAKSLIVSVLFPAWIWLQDPTKKIMCGSHARDLSIRDSVRCRDLMSGSWYQETFRPSWSWKGDQNVKSHYENSAGGFRFSTSVGAGVTGWRADLLLIDDPLDARKIPSNDTLTEVGAWVRYLRATRVNNPSDAQTVLIMQRVHEHDPVGAYLESEPEKWTKVILPSRAYDHKWRHPKDDREEGQLLFPEIFTSEVLSSIEIDLGPYRFALQHQQKSQPLGGGIIAPFNPNPEPPPPKFDVMIASWDCTFKGGPGSDYVVGSVWGANRHHDPMAREFWLLEVWRQKATFLATLDAIRAQFLRWPQLQKIVIEDKANGPAVINTLRENIKIIEPFSPERYGNKQSRLVAVSGLFAAGQVKVVGGDWFPSYRDEICNFPADHDDQVDSTTQALLFLRQYKKRRAIAGAL